MQNQKPCEDEVWIYSETAHWRFHGLTVGGGGRSISQKLKNFKEMYELSQNGFLEWQVVVEKMDPM